MTKRLYIAVLLTTILVPLQVQAAEVSPLLIVELQSRSSGAANAADEEFVELCNVSAAAVDLSKWQLEYKSATAATWSRKAILNGLLQAGDCYLLASTGYLTNVADNSFAPGLADSAGHVRLSAVAGEISSPAFQDVVGWGSNANAAEGNSPAAGLSAGKSLQRKHTEGNKYIDSNNNAADFMLSNLPTPESSYEVLPIEDDVPEVLPPVEPATEEPPVVSVPAEEVQPPESLPDIEPFPEPSAAANLKITELLPNPAAPATDSEDEFIEIYNSSNEPIDLGGYKLQTGTKYSYSHSFAAGDTIPSSGYFIITSGTSNLSLANTAGSARLLDPSGAVISEVLPYETAPDGQAWSLQDGGWQWTTTPTPLGLNVLTASLATPQKTTTSTKAAAKAKTTAKVAAPKAAKAATTKTSTKKAASTSENTVLAAQTDDGPAPLHPSILIGVSLAAIMYAAYEYRHDAANRLYQLRSYWTARRLARVSVSE